MKYIIANWKMNMNLSQVEDWLDEFSDLIPESGFKNKVILAGSFPHLAEIKNFCLEKEISCAAQDVSVHGPGAHTGFVGASQVGDFCDFCIVGHSERSESRNLVLEKRDACLDNQITPIVCFTNKEDWSNNFADGSLLAWEDPENISKDGVYREKDHSDISSAYEFFAKEDKDKEIIYGGSVNKDNVSFLTDIPNLGGVLVGNASLDPQHFLKIISAFQ